MKVIEIDGIQMISLTEAISLIVPNMTSSARWFQNNQSHFEKYHDYRISDERFPGRQGRIWLPLPRGLNTLLSVCLSASGRLHVAENAERSVKDFFSETKTESQIADDAEPQDSSIESQMADSEQPSLNSLSAASEVGSRKSESEKAEGCEEERRSNQKEESGKVTSACEFSSLLRKLPDDDIEIIFSEEETPKDVPFVQRMEQISPPLAGTADREEFRKYLIYRADTLLAMCEDGYGHVLKMEKALMETAPEWMVELSKLTISHTLNAMRLSLRDKFVEDVMEKWGK